MSPFSFRKGRLANVVDARADSSAKLCWSRATLPPSRALQQVKARISPSFLRLNFYSKVRWRVPIDPTKHYFDSKFEIKMTAHKQDCKKGL
jgi:hypothetical protein